MDDNQFEHLLADVAAGRGDTSLNLPLLSHLEGEQLSLFSTVWSELEEQPKLALLDALNRRELAETRLDFNAVYHLGIADDTAIVRRRSIEATIEDDSSWRLERLLALLADDSDPGVRAAVGAALDPFAQRAELGVLAPADATRIREALLNAYHRHDERPDVRAAALAAAGYFSHDSVRQELSAALDDAALRPAALCGMGHNADPVWLDVVLDQLSDTDDEVRQVAAQAAGEIGDEAAVPELINLVDDPVSTVRLTAIAALGEIGGAEAREALIYVLQDEDDAIRQAAQSALDEMDFFEDPLAT